MRQPTSPRGRGGIAIPARRFLRLLVALVAIALLSAGILFVVRARRARELGFAGARWIWVSASPERAPIHFSAIREFSLPAAPAHATARIFVDRRFALFVNGSRAAAGGQRPGEPSAAIDVAPLLRPGRNTVAIVAESPEGIGAILFALDTGWDQPAVVSDGEWSVDPSGRSVLAPGSQRAAVLGRPPMYPWGYPKE